MLLSIVIPYYQVENYIEACLERICMLDAQQCEVLLVDDCGSDASVQIARRYEQAYGHIRILYREKNGGLSAARNTGLREAKGEYVYFLDSDDIPQTQALFELAQQAKRQQLDVAKARFVYFDDLTGKERPGAAVEPTQVMTGGELFAAQCASGVYEPMVWQCVYRREFLLQSGLEMAEGLLFEDELFQAPALLRAQRAAAFDLEILRYRQREGSIMGSFARSSRWCASYLEVCRRLTALADTLDAGAPATALRRRVGQIALGTVKNIPAYGLPQGIAEEAKVFVRKHQRELSRYAMRSGSASVAVQGLLLAISIDAFIELYSHAKR